MNNKFNFVNTKEQPYLRFKNSEIIIKDPLLWIERGSIFVQMLKRIFQNNERIAIINTDPEYIGYAEFFEGSNIICYEESWAPGTLTNPSTKEVKPTLLVLVSAAKTDLKLVLTEIESVGLPVLNLSTYSVSRALFEQLSVPNRNFVHFYLQLIYHLMLKQQKKNITQNLATLFEEDNQDYHKTLGLFFQKLKTKHFLEKESEFYKLPKWIPKKFD